MQALNPDDPTGPLMQVRVSGNMVDVVCEHCGGCVGGGDRTYIELFGALERACPFCGKGPLRINTNDPK